MASPADVAASLVPTSVIGGSTGWSIKIGKLVSSPDKVAVFYDTGGSSPNPKWSLDFVTVQCIVRAPASQYNVGYDKIRQIRDSLLGLESQDVGPDRWVSITCPGDAGFINYDDKERPTFSINFRIIIEPAVSAESNREAL